MVLPVAGSSPYNRSDVPAYSRVELGTKTGGTVTGSGNVRVQSVAPEVTSSARTPPVPSGAPKPT